MYVTFTGFTAKFLYGFKCGEMEIKQWVCTSELLGRSMEGVIVGNTTRINGSVIGIFSIVLFER